AVHRGVDNQCRRRCCLWTRSRFLPHVAESTCGKPGNPLDAGLWNGTGWARQTYPPSPTPGPNVTVLSEPGVGCLTQSGRLTASSPRSSVSPRRHEEAKPCQEPRPGTPGG